MIPTTRTRPSLVPRPVIAILVAWVALALALTPLFRPTLPRPVVPLCIASVVTLGALLHRRYTPFRDFVRGLDLRALVAVHVVRIAFGAAFLARLAEGRIHPTFARVAGPGDVAAGLAAVVVVALITFAPARVHRPATLAWSALGLADMLAVIVTAQRIILFGEGPASLQFFELPYSLLPTLVVPAILLTHVAIVARVLRRSRG